MAQNFELILSTYIHDRLALNLGINRESCLIPDGDFRFISDFGVLDFVYTGDTSKKNLILKVAQKKIKLFLESKGFEVKRVYG